MGLCRSLQWSLQGPCRRKFAAHCRGSRGEGREMGLWEVGRISSLNHVTHPGTGWIYARSPASYEHCLGVRNIQCSNTCFRVRTISLVFEQSFWCSNNFPVFEHSFSVFEQFSGVRTLVSVVRTIFRCSNNFPVFEHFCTYCFCIRANNHAMFEQGSGVRTIFRCSNNVLGVVA